MNPALLEAPVQNFIREHAHALPADIALRKSPFPQVSSGELAEQIRSRGRIRKKLPHWYKTPDIYYPTLLALEQCSSEQTAAYKAGLMPRHKRIIDLTAGFGVDAYYMAARGNQVMHCELQTALSQIARHNLNILGAGNVDFRIGDGIQVLQEQAEDHYEFAFIDPSRRVAGQKVFTLQAAEPDVLMHQDTLNRYVKQWMMKAAPLLDIHAALRVLKHVRWIEVLSVGNEVKELLFLMQRHWDGPAQIRCTPLGQHQSDSFAFYPEEETSAEVSYALPQRYLYEPDAALMKAGCFKLIANRYHLFKLHPNTHLYTGEKRVEAFPGKIFEVLHVSTYAAFKKQSRVEAASIVTRNFPLKAEQIRRKYQLREDPDSYLFFFRDCRKALCVVFAKRLA